MKHGLRIAGVVALFSVATVALAADASVCLAPSELGGLSGLVADLSRRAACLWAGLVTA